MERAKLTSGNRQLKPAQPPEKLGRKPKVERLICRYCGSDDLAPSFIKRRDRRHEGKGRRRCGRQVLDGRAHLA
jgi:hypothetical protein